MYQNDQIAQQLFWIGCSDRRTPRFENFMPLPEGVTYNAYLILDEKTALLDTVDISTSLTFLENLLHTLKGRPLDYLIVNHVEPDHSAAIAAVCRQFPEVRVVGNAKTHQFISQFHGEELARHYLEVKDGETLSLGARSLTFYTAPMVHWPEVMMTYCPEDRILFSADAFGTFGAFSGSFWADEVDFAANYLNEARRYYTNIVGKYGPQVQAALKKLSLLDIQTVLPLHGPFWRSGFDWYVEKYQRWSTYTPEERGVVVAYGSMHGNTEQCAKKLGALLGALGVSVAMYDISKTHGSYIVADAFRYSHLVLAAPTYNMGLYHPMEDLLHQLSAMNVQNRKVALIGNGTWASQSQKIMGTMLDGMKGMEQLCPPLVLTSAMKESQFGELAAMAETIAKSVAATSL